LTVLSLPAGLLKRARAPVAELNKQLEHLKTKARVAWAFVLKKSGAKLLDTSRSTPARNGVD